ncbi:MAG: S41 family peptidase [Patescibacteria group bacterium]
MDLRPKVKNPRSRQILRSALNVAILVAIFIIGMNVGNGRLDWHRNQPVSKDLPAKLNYETVNDVYEALKTNYDGKLTQAQLENGLKHGLAASTNDPYTSYFTAKEAKDFNDQLNNSFSGIGAQLGKDKEGNLEVIAPIDGLPADKAGIQAKDIIASVNGTSTSGMSVDDAVSRIRGPKGTKVKLQIVRNYAEALSFTITRQDINLPSVKTKILDGNIGYLQITSFSNDTVELAQKAAEDFKQKNVKGIILDMRDNPGGLLEASIKVSSLWLSQGSKILDEKQGSTIIDTDNAIGGNILSGIPTVVLINSGSASASEITAGALHDNKAAYIIGEKSYGKGVVQQLVNFGDGSQLKVTVASWYRPNGQNINKQGIKPDKTIKPTETEVKADIDSQLQAAQDYLKR